MGRKRLFPINLLFRINPGRKRQGLSGRFEAVPISEVVRAVCCWRVARQLW